MQRHFCVFAVNFPGTESLERIYSAVLKWHFSAKGGELTISSLRESSAMWCHFSGEEYDRARSGSGPKLGAR